MNAETPASAPGPEAGGDVLLRVENVVKYFPVQSSRLWRRENEVVHAVDGVNLVVNLGDIFSGPLFPAECANRLIPLGIPTIRGNHERQPAPRGRD